MEFFNSKEDVLEIKLTQYGKFIYSKGKFKPTYYSFIKKEEHPDISFRRVGVYAGKIDTETADKSIQSHYFIKFTNDKSITDNINKLSTITYDFNNTVGPKSISKQELIFKIL